MASKGRANAQGKTLIGRVYHLDRGFEASRRSSANATPKSKRITA
jgi:UDP-N-acetylglucosamine enolpyruvyl transferase